MIQAKETTSDTHNPAQLISGEPLPLKYLQTLGATTGQVPTFNGTTVVWGSPGAGNPSLPLNSVQYNVAGAFQGDADFLRGSSGEYFGVRSVLAPSVTTQFLQDLDIFGIGINGVFNGYSDDAFATYFLGTLAGDFTAVGGKSNAMIVGYQNTMGGANANTNYGHDSVTGESNVRIEASSLAQQIRIELETDGVTQALRFDFGGGETYNFPSTQATVAGSVLTDTGANGLLSWEVPASTNLTIGDPITGGGANRILFENGTNDLDENSNFAYNQTTGVFAVAFGGGNRLVVDPTTGRYDFGDVTAIANKNVITIDDTSGLISNQFSSQWQVLDANTSYQYLKISNGDIDLSTFGNSNIIKIGDARSDGNDTFFEVNDFARQVFVQTDGDFGVQTVAGARLIDAAVNGGPGNFAVKIGDANSLGNGTQVSVDDGGRTVVIGDVNGVVNGARIGVDDSSGLIDFTFPASIDIGMRLTSAGFGTYAGNSGFTFTTATVGNPIYADFSNTGGSFVTILGDVSNAISGGKITINPNLGGGTSVTSLQAMRFETAKGNDVVAANNMTLGGDGNVFVITGNTQINLINGLNWQQGSEITLQFTGSPTLKHNQAPSGTNLPLFLAGSVDFAITNLTQMKFVRIGGTWYELCRTVA